ncbi:hypothetical protein BJX65DRAFT_313411 [Aspergillus insuetus]
MPVIEALLGISTCLGNTVIGAFLGSWLSVRFWVPRLTRPADTPNTDGLTLKDVNQLRLKKLFLAVERVQSEAIAITEGTGLRIGVYDLPLRPDEESQEEDWDYEIIFKPSHNSLETVESMTEYIIEHSNQLWHDDEAHNQQTAHDACSDISVYFANLNRKRGKLPSAMDGHIFSLRCATMSSWKELLAVLGFMLTRMKSLYLEDHHVVPVMVISCFKNHSARKLQACLTDYDLIIGKSSLYDFSNPKSRAENLPLFLAYMASQPVGTTRCEAASSSPQ